MHPARLRLQTRGVGEFGGRLVGDLQRLVDLYDGGIRFTNGIAFGPDQALYVNETLSGMVYRYPWSGGQVGARANFGNVIDPQAAPGYNGPDGMKFDADGLLYESAGLYGQSTRRKLELESGAVLLEERPKKGPVKSFEEAARENASRQEQARAQLARAMEERKHRDEILEKKFREAVKKAEKDEAPPPLRPFDLD